MSFKKSRPTRLPESSSDVLQQLAPILIVVTGIVFNGLVGLIAIKNLGDTVSLIKLLAMEIPVASVYVSGGNRFSMLIHFCLFTLISISSAWGGNLGLALAAFSIMTCAVLNVLRQMSG